MQCRNVKILDIIVVPNIFSSNSLGWNFEKRIKRALTQSHSIDSHECVWMDFHKLLVQSHILRELIEDTLHTCSYRNADHLHVVLPIHSMDVLLLKGQLHKLFSVLSKLIFLSFRQRN